MIKNELRKCLEFALAYPMITIIIGIVLFTFSFLRLQSLYIVNTSSLMLFLLGCALSLISFKVFLFFGFETFKGGVVSPIKFFVGFAFMVFLSVLSFPFMLPFMIEVFDI